MIAFIQPIIDNTMMLINDGSCRTNNIVTVINRIQSMIQSNVRN